jgi:hypothetical protein
VRDEPAHNLQPPPGQRPKEKWKGERGRLEEKEGEEKVEEEGGRVREID